MKTKRENANVLPEKENFAINFFFCYTERPVNSGRPNFGEISLHGGVGHDFFLSLRIFCLKAFLLFIPLT